jgi:hypothetical protein
MKVSLHIYKIIEILCRAIKERRFLYFYYESGASGKKEWREIKPYKIMPTDKGNLSLVGLPIEQFKEVNYLLDKLDTQQFKILNRAFDDPGVSRDIVIHTKKPVVCRFIYDDEDLKEVMKDWIKIPH